MPQWIEIGRERAERRLEARAKRRSLLQLHAASGVIEDLAEDARIGRRRIPHRALTREEHERDAAADHLPSELLGKMTCRTEPVGLDVARGHALRHVDREHDVDAEPARGARAQVDVRTGERDDEARERDEDQRRLQQPAGATARDQRCRAAERSQRADPREVRQRHERGDQRDSQEEQQQLRPREAKRRKVHGVLRKTVSASRNCSASSAAPAAANGSDASSVEMNARVPTRAFSSVSISRYTSRRAVSSDARK